MDYTEIPSGFNPLSYLILNPDVRRNAINPFIHYINHGRAEKRPYRTDQKHRMILACIMKMEEDYLLEWIAYHRNEGFDHFIIGDNGGSEKQTSILIELSAIGVIDRVDLIGRERPQLAFYDNILKRNNDPNSIIGFIDTDEFVFPQDPLRLGASEISSLFDDRTVGAVGLNWAIYGSAGLANYSDEPVVKRFQYHARQIFPPNRHIKSFVRSGSSRRFTGAPHAVVIEGKHKYISASGEPIQWQGVEGSGISAEPIWGKVRLNHYILKSRSEYEFRKNRGSATSAKNDMAKQSNTYFAEFDQNEVLEPFPEFRCNSLRWEMDRLRQAIDENQSTPSVTMTATPKMPDMTFPTEVAAFVSQLYGNASAIIEYGSGGSTILAGSKQGTTVFSVESDGEWVAMMRRWFQHRPPLGTVHLQHVNIGATKEWGYPKDNSRLHQFIDYPMNVWERSDLLQPEVVLIDGRFRVGCFVATLVNIRRPTTVLFDDYGDRPHYHIVEQLLRPVKVVGRMAVFEATPRALHPTEWHSFGSFFFRPE